jgi:hypothetical protein
MSMHSHTMRKTKAPVAAPNKLKAIPYPKISNSIWLALIVPFFILLLAKVA